MPSDPLLINEDFNYRCINLLLLFLVDLEPVNYYAKIVEQ